MKLVKTQTELQGDCFHLTIIQHSHFSSPCLLILESSLLLVLRYISHSHFQGEK